MKTMKQYQIAQCAGVTPGFLSQVLTGKKRPKWPTAKKLASAVPGTTEKLWLEGTPDEIRTAIKNASQH